MEPIYANIGPMMYKTWPMITEYCMNCKSKGINGDVKPCFDCQNGTPPTKYKEEASK